MSSLNKVMLIGNLGKDPDVNTVGNDRKVAKFSLATTETWKDQKGEKQEATEWHNIVVWGKTADVVEKYLKKGDKVYVEGKVKTRKYQDKDGADRYITEITVDSLVMLSTKGGGGGSSSGSSSGGGGKSNIDDLDI